MAANSNSKSKSHLRLLGDLILTSIDAIEARLSAECVEFPALGEPLNPMDRAESVLLEDEMLAATSHIIAAASQLIAMVRSPVQTIMEYSLLVCLQIPRLSAVGSFVSSSFTCRRACGRRSKAIWSRSLENPELRYAGIPLGDLVDGVPGNPCE
jgi:hypothetical protein